MSGEPIPLLGEISTYLLVYCRLQTALIALPAFSERLLPARLRIGLALCLTPLMALTIGAQIAVDSPQLLALFALTECVTGLILGAAVRLVALALDIAASTIATTASLSQIMGVTNEFAPHPVGNLLHLAGIATIMALGFPLVFCDLLIQSFELRGLGQWPDTAALMPVAIRIVADAFMLAMLLAAPFILGGLLFQGLSGMISKVMPALPVIFIGAPAAILLALIALTLIAPAILTIWADHVLSLDASGLP